MTNKQHPITSPPEELLDKWEGEWHHYRGKYTYTMFMAEQAAQWGADQELEACCEWMRERGLHPEYWRDFRAARRPKPLSLKEQALETLNWMESEASYDKPMIETIRRALEEL